MHTAMDDPATRKVVCMKSAQVAWTDGALLNYLGRRIDIDPCPIIVMFAKDHAAKQFNSEKFEPMCEATPCLADKIPVSAKRDKDNRWEFKGFPGGFLKFVGSNSPSSVKSTPAPVVCVEEPDDCNENVQQQGDTITLLEERTKSYARAKVIFGGTPTVEGFSRIEAAYKSSDRRMFWIPCPHCGEFQTLSWEHVHWTESAEVNHEVYGLSEPLSARYCCPHCSSMWTDAEKNRAVRQGQWRAEAPFAGIAGFFINELYSPFPGSKFSLLVEKYLAAQHALAQGDDTKARSFRNNTEGLPYAFKSEVPEASDLKLRAEDYAEKSVPLGGLILTAGVDVQHDRLAVVIRAWGRGEESWLVYWGEIFGSTLIPGQGAWADLDLLLTADFVHATGAVLHVSAASIDGSDGNRTEIVNAYVRMRKHRHYLSVKGASEQVGDKKEIFSSPRKADVGRKQRPAKRGLDTYIVGTNRAKDLILETRVKLSGSGAGRMHWYSSVRADYWDQLVSEVKAPSKFNRNKKSYQKKAGVRNEGLDCEVYALHAARACKVHLMHEAHWVAIERQLRQRTLLAPDPEPVAEPDDDEDMPPLEASAGDGANVRTDNPAPGERETVEAPAVAPVHARAQPVKKQNRKSPRSGGGWKVGNW